MNGREILICVLWPAAVGLVVAGAFWFILALATGSNPQRRFWRRLRFEITFWLRYVPKYLWLSVGYRIRMGSPLRDIARDWVIMLEVLRSLRRENRRRCAR